MNCCNEQDQGILAMDHPGKRHGCGRWAQVPKKEKELSTSEHCRGRKSVERLISKDAEAYCEGIDEGIQKILEEWEEEVKQHSETNAKMDDQRTLVPDLGNTRGSIAQFKQTSYLYWLIKSLMGKDMEHISVSMVVTVQDMLSYKQEFQKVQFQLHKQDIRLGRIERHIRCILELFEMPGSNVKYPAPMELASE